MMCVSMQEQIRPNKPRPLPPSPLSVRMREAGRRSSDWCSPFIHFTVSLMKSQREVGGASVWPHDQIREKLYCLLGPVSREKRDLFCLLLLLCSVYVKCWGRGVTVVLIKTKITTSMFCRGRRSFFFVLAEDQCDGFSRTPPPPMIVLPLPGGFIRVSACVFRWARLYDCV